MRAPSFLFHSLAICLLLSLSSWAIVTSDRSQAVNKTFDYIIVGGGLTGITLASRLSEDPSLQILLVEVGGDNRTNPSIYDIYQSGFQGSGLVWSWPTEGGKSIRG